ncbi:MAG: uracil phosphoribosyltransferase [Anaerolineales bacterium]|nr:uracil phosphoribosyltransferase [Anaerolineales bacterium]MCB9172914.1 uracil phosphoribosyltransferase [Ardenticatenales bacterium]
MAPTIFESQHPLVKHKIDRLRRPDTDPKTFRELVRELSILLAYEATQDLALTDHTVDTGLGVAHGATLQEQIGLIPILRAGLGMVEGVWEMMPSAEVWHIGLYRDEATLRPVAYYNKLPVAPTVQLCLVLDPMLATGGSASATVSILKAWGAERIKFLALLAAPEGIARMTADHPDVHLHIAQIDDHLTPEPESTGDPPRGFIVPGLGDAGDRQFGTG